MALQPFVIQLASGATVTVAPGEVLASTNAIVTAAPALFSSAITLGANNAAAPNPNPVAVAVTVSGGTVSGISVNGASTGLTTGTFTVPAYGSITVAYSVAPTTFTTAPVVAAGQPYVNSILAGYLAAHPAGPQYP
jgi:hypothetical protein